jgi:riboflavin kinase/FMN adenylyltransferase
MEILRGLDGFPTPRRATAVAVGNFDGLHLGHRKILARVCGLARAQGLRSLVLTFDPHPERALGRKSVRMIETLEQRLASLRESCVDAVLVIPFDRSFSKLTGPEFVEGVLVGRLTALHVVVGRDFRFGRNRRSDNDRLRKLGRRFGLRVHVVPPVVLRGRVVSSSLIRRLLGEGRVEEAARFLGRPYEISGQVVRGAERGRRIGVPTANITPANEILPEGVFITETVWKGRPLPSVTSIGTNPTFGRNPLSVETHILDGRFPLYGAGLVLRFLSRIRPTRRFRNAGSLLARIRKDIEAARAYFGEAG